MQDKLFQNIDKLKKLPQNQISAVLQFILFIYIAWLLAQITWQLFPKPQMHLLESEAVNTVNSASVVADISKITQLNLFGDYSAQPDAEIEIRPEDAPETTLNLKLTGVVPSTDKNLAAAIIEKSGSQEVYGIDEKIDGTRAVVKEIFADRVILEQSGRRETLMLEGQDYNAIVSNVVVTEPVETESASDTASLTDENKQALEQIREEAFTDPGKIMDYLKVSPVRRDGELIGYRLYPGKEPQLFNSVGLSPGDIATEINGYDLTNLSQAMQAMEQLKEAQEASLIVERNGSVKQIYISLY